MAGQRPGRRRRVKQGRGQCFTRQRRQASHAHIAGGPGAQADLVMVARPRQQAGTGERLDPLAVMERRPQRRVHLLERGQGGGIVGPPQVWRQDRIGGGSKG